MTARESAQAAEVDVKRIFARELRTFSPTGSPCEVCRELMRDHQWADMDLNGFVVACSQPAFTPGAPQ